MAELHVVTALVAKRAELSGDLERLYERRDAIKAHIANLDAVMEINYARYGVASPCKRASKGRIKAPKRELPAISRTVRGNGNPQIRPEHQQ